MTLSMPVSSSRLRKVTPPAVAGRCRWVTIPPTRTRRPCSTRASRGDRHRAERVEAAPGRTAPGGSSGREAGGPHVGDQPARPSSMPGSVGASLPAMVPGSRSGRVLGGRAGRPQRLPPGQPEAGEGVRGGQRLQVRGGAGRPAGPGRAMSRYGPSPSARPRSARPARRRGCGPRTARAGPPARRAPSACGGSPGRAGPTGSAGAVPGSAWRRWR